MQPNYLPDFDSECTQCATSPTVQVVGHSQPETGLCGTCFFADRGMVDWSQWNNELEATE